MRLMLRGGWVGLLVLAVGCGQATPVSIEVVAAASLPRHAPLSPVPRPIACGGDEDAPRVELDCRDLLHSRLNVPRAGVQVVALDGGHLLVVGGGDEEGAFVAMASAELYDPALGDWVELALPDGVETGIWEVAQLVGFGEGAFLVDPASNVFRFSLDTRRWTPIVASPVALGGEMLPYVTATVLSDGALLVVGHGEVQEAALFDGERWTRVADVAPAIGGDDGRPPGVDWLAPLPGGDALLGGVRRYHRDRDVWTEIDAPRRVVQGDYLVAPLGEGRVAVLGGCSDTRECWGDGELDVFVPTTDTWHTSPVLIHREHSLGPVGAVLGADASGPPRVMLSSDFGEGREIELCRVGPVDDAMPDCRCGGCGVVARGAAAAVRDPARNDCMLLIGGVVREDAHPALGLAIDEVLRLCWTDRQWASEDGS